MCVFGGIAPASDGGKRLPEECLREPAPSARRRPGYPLAGCTPAEPASVSPGVTKLPHESRQARKRVKENRRPIGGRGEAGARPRDDGTGGKVETPNLRAVTKCAKETLHYQHPG